MRVSMPYFSNAPVSFAIITPFPPVQLWHSRESISCLTLSCSLTQEVLRRLGPPRGSALKMLFDAAC